MSINLLIFNLIGFSVLIVSLMFNILKIKDKKNIKIISFILSILTFLFLIVSNIYVYSNPEKITSNQKEEAVTIPNNIDNSNKATFTKENAISSFTNLLKEIKKENNTDELLEKLLNDDIKLSEIVTEESLDYIYFTDFLKDDEEAMRSTFISLVSFIKVLEESKNNDFNVVYTEYNNVIYLDNKSNTANIPANLYTGNLGSISFEMIYVDDTWKLAPYSMLESVSLSTQIQSIYEEK